MRFSQNKYIELNSDFSFCWRKPISNKNATNEIVKKLQENYDLKITEHKDHKKLRNVVFNNFSETWLILKVNFSGIKGTYKLRIQIPPLSKELKKKINRIIFYHFETGLFFITFSNDLITDSNESSSFWIDFWWFFYFHQLGSFVLEISKRKRKAKILITDEFKNVAQFANSSSLFRFLDDKVANSIKSSTKENLRFFINYNAKLGNIKYLRLSLKEKDIITKLRIGQGLFRSALLKKYNKCCPITTICKTNLLVASHVKPWKDCKVSEAKDDKNGILLSPLFDQLFDKGLISFDINGKIIYSSKLSKRITSIIKEQIKNLNYAKEIINNVGDEYLEWHRKKVFKIK